MSLGMLIANNNLLPNSTWEKSLKRKTPQDLEAY